MVLSRREGETIMIGDRISVTVRDIGAGRVALDVQAPPEVTVHRLEVWRRILDERRRAKDRKARR
jgi:carbon storage regulator